MDLFAYDDSQHVRPLCGVDEAGRGPLAGEVVAAAVILPQECGINGALEGLNDSKKLSEKKRERLYEEIITTANSYAIGVASVDEIETVNILGATHLAMQRAVDGLDIVPALVLVDGNQPPKLAFHTKSIVKGDSCSACIAAASILAKVTRDRMMQLLDQQYPVYGFAKHKGYGTKAHFEAINQHGISPLHRKSFLKKLLCTEPSEVPSTRKTGEKGEQFATKFLQKHGYEIIAKNYRMAGGEIDIIATKGEILAFVEVKARHESALYPAQEAVTKSKQAKIKQAAMHYLTEHNFPHQPRFDVCEVYFTSEGRVFARMVENAFT